MERSKNSISPDALYARLGSEAAPIIVDVRRDADFAGADRLGPAGTGTKGTPPKNPKPARRADTSGSPQCGGLFVSLGLSAPGRVAAGRGSLMAMSYKMKPLGCDPARIKGMSERMIISHYENNYGGAVKRLNLIGEKLAELDYAAAPGFMINGLKREELIATNSMILHEYFFESLGDQSEPDAALQEALTARFRLIGTVAFGVHRHGQGARRRLRLGAAVMVAARPQARQSMGI